MGEAGQEGCPSGLDTSDSGLNEGNRSKAEGKWMDSSSALDKEIEWN